jgi:hypothetical protein
MSPEAGRMFFYEDINAGEAMTSPTLTVDEGIAYAAPDDPERPNPRPRVASVGSGVD